MSNELSIKEPVRELSAFSTLQTFEIAQRMATALANSELVPKVYQKNVANCIVALEVAQRCQASPLMVMQNLNIINGRPSWSATYIIAAVNSCGKFEPLKFKVEGEGDNKVCIAWTRDKSGEVLESPPVSIAMAKAEGWFQKSGSKWQTMPDLMLRYRAAAFFGRLYASEILMGMRSEDEEREVVDVTAQTEVTTTKSAAEILNSKVRMTREPEVLPVEPQKADIETVKAKASLENKPKDEPVKFAGESHF